MALMNYGIVTMSWLNMVALSHDSPDSRNVRSLSIADSLESCFRM